LAPDSRRTEIRNQIYEHILETSDIASPNARHLITLRPDSKAPFERITTAHVNRQIRTEYRSLFLRRFEISVTVKDMDHFLDTFLSLSDEPSACEAKVVFIVRKISEVTLGITPLLKVFRAAPKVSILFAHVHCGSAMAEGLDGVNGFLAKWQSKTPVSTTDFTDVRIAFGVFTSRHSTRPGIFLWYYRWMHLEDEVSGGLEGVE
jgi:hypothetical protein